MRDRYSTVQITLHWLVLLLLILTYSAMLLKDAVPDEYYTQAKTTHFTAGSLVWLLMLLRLGLRFIYATPAIKPPLPDWQRRTAQALHGVLYLLYLSLPVLGLLTLAYSGRAGYWFDWRIPAIVTPDPSFSATLKAVHETLASVGYFLIGLHTFAALYHHYLRLDNTLLRMLPTCKKRG